MVSGSYNGASIDVSDVLVVGALGVAAYFIYKSVVQPVAKIGNAISDAFVPTTTPSGFVMPPLASAIFPPLSTNALGQDLSLIGSQFLKLFTQPTTTSPDVNLGQLQTAGMVSGSNPITKAQIDAGAFGYPTQTLTTAKGSSTIIAVPNTYYAGLGVGFNAQGQGYSSAFAPTSKANAYYTLIKQTSF